MTSLFNSNSIKLDSKLVKSAILKTNTYLRPQPSLFYYPGLTSKPIWDKNQFEITKVLESNFSTIREEYLNAKYSSNSNSTENKGRLVSDYCLINNEHSLHKGNWNWYSYIQKGKKNNENFKNFFPKTYNILNSLDNIIYDIPFAYSFFSELSNNSEIDYHYGPCNLRLRVHLGIDIPDTQDCYINIAENKYFWENGKCLIFDDSYIHSVVNNFNKSRTILLIDIWHPELYKEEIEAFVSMFNKGKQMIDLNKKI